MRVPIESLISPILRGPPPGDKPAPPARAGSPVGTVLLCIFLSGMATAFSMYFLGQNLDGRLAVTTVDTFHNFFALRDAFLAVTSYPLAANPVSLAHGVFDPTPDSLQEWQDIRNRRLISAASYDAAVAVFNASTQQLLSLHRGDLLWNVLRVSWCSYPNALAGTTPTTRSPGCACIGKAYLDFIRETAGNRTGAVTINTTLAARDKYGAQALTCFDQRQVSRTQTCGLVCTTHAMDLMLFINSITFLFLCAYLLFSEQGSSFVAGLSGFTQMLVLKLVVVVLAGLLAVPFIVYDIQAHVPNLCGLILSVVYITVTLHEQLDFPALRRAMEFVQGRSSVYVRFCPFFLHVTLSLCRYTGSKRRPHPLTATLLIHLQLILPAYGVIISASGYGRDSWAMLSFGTALWLMGLAMQVRLFFYFLVLFCFLTGLAPTALLLGVLVQRQGRQPGEPGVPAGQRRRAADPADPALRGVLLRGEPVHDGEHLVLLRVRGVPRAHGGAAARGSRVQRVPRGLQPVLLVLLQHVSGGHALAHPAAQLVRHDRGRGGLGQHPDRQAGLAFFFG